MHEPAGDICGSGFNPRKQGKVCDLHTNVVSTDALITYWDQLPVEHRQMLFSLPRHDFETELDSCCSCALLSPLTTAAAPRQWACLGVWDGAVTSNGGLHTISTAC